MAGPMVAEGKSRKNSAGIVLTENDRRRLLVLGTAILMMLAASIYIYDAIAPHSGAGLLSSCTGSQDYYSCVSAAALSEKNVSVCGYLSGGQQQACVLNVSESTLSPRSCGYLSGSAYYDSCLLYINTKTGNMSICGNLGPVDALGCIYNTSASDNFSDVSECAQLSGGYKTDCTSLHYFKNALASGSPAGCGSVDGGVNSTLLYFVSQFGGRNASSALSSLFLYSQLNVSVRSFCYYAVAVKTGNSSACGSISGNFSTICSDAVLQLNVSKINFNLNATNITAACGAYSGYAGSTCQFKYSMAQAIKLRSATPCQILNLSISQSLCVLQLAVNTSDGAFCGGIANGTIKSICDRVENVTT